MAASVLLLMSLWLTGCEVDPTRQMAEKFSTVRDPQQHAPDNHWSTWKPTSSRKELVADLKTTTIIPDGNRLVQAHKSYQLDEIIDLGLKANPQTRSAWENARAAASGVGIAEAYWLPVLSASMLGGYWQYPFPGAGSAFSLKGTSVNPTLSLSWTLFDMARKSRIEIADQALFSSNFTLNRTHQQIAFDIQKTFYQLLAAKSRVEASEINLKQATTIAEAITRKLEQGLATKPEALMAIQDQAKAGYELQSAQGQVWQKEAELAEHVGITPNAGLQTIGMKDLPLPEAMEGSADMVIDRALEGRPDLAAKLAEVRAKDAAIRKSEATFWPTFQITGEAGYKVWNYQNANGGAANQNVSISEPVLSSFLTMNWNIFEGFAGVNAIDQAKAQQKSAEAEFQTLQLRIIRDVWKAYADLKTSTRKREFALAMLKAADQSYAAAMQSYDQGVATCMELLTAERNLAAARYTEIDSKANVLEAAAALVFASGQRTETAGDPRSGIPDLGSSPIAAQTLP